MSVCLIVILLGLTLGAVYKVQCPRNEVTSLDGGEGLPSYSTWPYV